jgi:hypothetical protein
MCHFVLLQTLCRHKPPTLLAGPFCQALKQQLMAIDDSNNFAGDNASFDMIVPFRLDPATCEPHLGNTLTVSTWCGWECFLSSHEQQQQNVVVGTSAGSYASRFGEPGAQFGVPRSGVGWRNERGVT